MVLQTEPLPLVARTPLDKMACFLLIAGSLLYYWSVFFHHALDAGQADDFVDALWFIEIFLEQSHWPDTWRVLLLPNHEHVTLFNHLVYLADYALFGKISFFHCMLVGHVIVLACCVLLADWLKKTVGWWYALALAFGLFLNLFYWHASFWAMTALSNQAVILFALLAARSASNNLQAIMAPLCWSLLAVATQFNGLLVLPALIAARFRTQSGQKPWPWLVIWAGAFVAVTTLYVSYESPFASDHLWRYVNYTDPGNLAQYAKASSGEPWSVAQAAIQVPLAWLAASGATVFDLVHWVPAAVTGFLLWLLWLYRMLRGGNTTVDVFWLGMLLFVATSLALVAIGRGSAFGAEAGLLYRYRLYSFLLLLLVLGGVLQIRPSMAMLRALLPVCVVVQVLSWHVLDDIDTERSAIKVSHYYWLVDGGMGRSQMPFYPHNQDLRLFNAYERGYYNAYQAIDSRHKPASVVPASPEACAANMPAPAGQPVIQAWSKKSRALAVEITLDKTAAPHPAQVLFCYGTEGYLLALGQRNVDPATGKYWPLLVLKKALPPSQYRVYVYRDGVASQWLGDIAFP